MNIFAYMLWDADIHSTDWYMPSSGIAEVEYIWMLRFVDTTAVFQRCYKLKFPTTVYEGPSYGATLWSC